MGQLAGDLKIEVAIVQIIMFPPQPAQFERTKSAANSLVFDNSLFRFGHSLTTVVDKKREDSRKIKKE